MGELVELVFETPSAESATGLLEEILSAAKGMEDWDLDG